VHEPAEQLCVVCARAGAAAQIRATLEQSTAIAFFISVRSFLKLLRLTFPTEVDTGSYRGRVPIRG
jgi:hypothetical protein